MGITWVLHGYYLYSSVVETPQVECCLGEGSDWSPADGGDTGATGTHAATPLLTPPTPTLQCLQQR